MKIIRTTEFAQIKNPTSQDRYKQDVLTAGDNAMALGGHFSTLRAGGVLPAHYHQRRESLIFVLAGEIVEIVDGVAHTLKAGDAIFLAAGEKHRMENRSAEEARYLEFFAPPGRDTVAAE